MRFHIQIVLLLLMVILVISCQGFQKNKTKEAEIQDLINEKVAERVEDFRQKRLVICRERVLETASEKADSIIMATAIDRNIIDSISRPAPPPRPLRPPIKSPLDTTPVTPLFQPDTSQ